MGSLRLSGWRLAVAIITLGGIGGCGGHHTVGVSQFPAKVTLSPSNSTSVQLGNIISFTASAQNATGQNVSTAFSFASNDTSILNIAPNGVACAGIWDASFTTCTPGGIGVVQVTASAQGSNSAPTYVFVHPKIDNIRVTGILLNGAPIPEPCLSQGQTMTVQAQAFSQGVDVTSSVGPFTWSASNASVVKLTPLVNSAYNFATNQATAAAVNPGTTQIVASASGVSSTAFQQPDLVDSPPLIFDFFETCPIQNITLEVGRVGSLQASFAVAKGASETVFATITDVMGNSSLPNLNNGITLSKIPLTWTASQPAVANVATGCTESCAVSTPSPGAGSITASCTPPSCNIGFPQVPAAFTPSSLNKCATYLHSLFPQITTCEEFIPVPVYATPLPATNALPKPPAGISAFVTGTPGPTSVLATSVGCANELPTTCSVGIFDLTTTRGQSGVANPTPDAPNSLLYSRAGDKVYMGSNYGAQSVNPANFGTSNSPYTPLGTVTGSVLATSPNGNLAIFSDTIHIPNQVYVVNQASASQQVTPLNIASASVAAFSPDGLKAFIFGFDTNNLPNLYVYSTLQALQVIALPLQTSVSAIAFSNNSAFAYIASPSVGGGGPAISVLNTCDNQPATDAAFNPQVISLAASPVAFKALPDGVHFAVLEANGAIDYITAAIAGLPSATLTTAATNICSATVGATVEHAMTVTHTTQTINLNQGNIHPLDFFLSADGTLIYVLASDLNSVIIYNFATGSVAGGIQLASTPGGINPTPVMADISADAGTIVVAASDGYVHQVSTSIGGNDAIQNPFPNLANYSNPFCTFTPASGPCVLNLIAVKP